MLTLRNATLADADILVQQRNEPTTRAASRNTEIVGRDWAESSLATAGRMVFVAENDGVVVGTCRTDVIDDATELSWSVAEVHRGKGYGKEIARQLAAKVQGAIVAEIKPGNDASVRIAESIGMCKIGESGGLLIFKRD